MCLLEGSREGRGLVFTGGCAKAAFHFQVFRRASLEDAHEVDVLSPDPGFTLETGSNDKGSYYKPFNFISALACENLQWKETIVS